MFEVFRKEVDWAGASSCSKPARSRAPGRRRRDGHLRRHHRAGRRRVREEAEARPRFLPADRELPGEGLRRGQDPRGFFKREGRPSEKEILTSRLIDRPIRPLFHESYRNETLVVVTTLAHDLENDPDILSMVATSARSRSRRALHGPDRRGARRLRRRNFHREPDQGADGDSALDLVVAGTKKAC